MRPSGLKEAQGFSGFPGVVFRCRVYLIRCDRLNRVARDEPVAHSLFQCSEEHRPGLVSGVYANLVFNFEQGAAHVRRCEFAELCTADVGPDVQLGVLFIETGVCAA